MDSASDNGTLYMTEDAFAGSRSGRGHVWTAPFVPYPSGVTPVPLPSSNPDPGIHTCAITVPVPALASGNTYWVQFTAHDAGVLSTTWTLPVVQSAQLQLYPQNPFTGLADPVAKGPVNGAIAKQVTSNSTTFDVSTAPTSEIAQTYTVQFFNGGPSLAATTASINYNNDVLTACPASPLVGHIAN